MSPIHGMEQESMFRCANLLSTLEISGCSWVQTGKLACTMLAAARFVLKIHSIDLDEHMTGHKSLKKKTEKKGTDHIAHSHFGMIKDK